MTTFSSTVLKTQRILGINVTHETHSVVVDCDIKLCFTRLCLWDFGFDLDQRFQLLEDFSVCVRKCVAFKSCL